MYASRHCYREHDFGSFSHFTSEVNWRGSEYITKLALQLSSFRNYSSFDDGRIHVNTAIVCVLETMAVYLNSEKKDEKKTAMAFSRELRPGSYASSPFFFPCQWFYYIFAPRPSPSLSLHPPFLKCSGEKKNVLEAAPNGTTVGSTIIGQIVASVIGFLVFIALLNNTLLWFDSIVNVDFLTIEVRQWLTVTL